MHSEPGEAEACLSTRLAELTTATLTATSNLPEQVFRQEQMKQQLPTAQNIEPEKQMENILPLNFQLGSS